MGSILGCFLGMGWSYSHHSKHQRTERCKFNRKRRFSAQKKAQRLARRVTRAHA